jgi:hypothetical protein
VQKKIEEKHRLILLIVPAGFEGSKSKITLSVELKGNKILADRILHIKKLTIH